MSEPSGRDDARSRIVEVAARLLHEHGPAAVTTRGVAEAAGVQAPAIYRLFGDKDGLLEAVAVHVMSEYVAAKVAGAAAAQDVEPLADLRSGWHDQIAFGLANPGIFRLLSDPDRVRDSVAAQSGRRVLISRVQRVAATGVLRVSEQRACDLIQAAGIGVIQTLLSVPPERRDPNLAGAMFDTVLARIATEQPARHDDATLAAAVAVRAAVADLDELSPAERMLMAEWLDRVIAEREP